MSRIGKQPITLPENVEFGYTEGKVTVKGPKGTLQREISYNGEIKQEGNQIVVINRGVDNQSRADHGLVRALINKPRLVLADEPTGNLDSENTANVYKRFRDVNERYGTTFVVVTHDRRIAEQTDRIVEIRDGRILMDINK